MIAAERLRRATDAAHAAARVLSYAACDVARADATLAEALVARDAAYDAAVRADAAYDAARAAVAASEVGA